jgi:signal transduction histidine kinase
MQRTNGSKNGSTKRLWLLGGTLVAASAAVTIALVRTIPTPSGTVKIPWWALAAMFGAAEVFVVHLQFRRGDAHSFSLSEVPLTLGLFFTAPMALVAAHALGAVAALTIHRRQSPVKVFFNVGHLTLETGLAVLVFHAVRGRALIGPAAWGAAFLAAMTTAILASLLVALAISISQGSLKRSAVARSVFLAVIVGLSNTCLGLLGAHVIWRDPVAAWLLLAPAAVVFLAYRGFGVQRSKHESMQFLYESTRLLQRSIEIDSTLRAVMDQGRKMFRADIASITFLAADGEPPLRTTCGPGDFTTGLLQVELDPLTGVWARVASEGQAILLARPIRNERLQAHFAARGIQDAMVAPIFGENGVIGTFLVGNRLGDVSTFDEGDLQMFETLANHASIAIRNARLVARLKDSLSRQTELNRMKDDFVATISHELRTPLTSILGFVQTMLRPTEFAQEDMRSFLEIVDRQAQRLSALIEDLLMVSRVETQTVVSSSGKVSAERVVRNVVADLGPRVGTHEIVLSAASVPPVYTDEEFIYRIVSNLVDNAIKYSPPESRVTLGVSTAEDGVRISIEDEGEGIPPHLHERVFDRFFQADQSRTRSVGGAGLGLYICRSLTEAIGGRLNLERSDPAGSIFSLWIPLQTSARADDGISDGDTKPEPEPVQPAPATIDFASGSARNN